MTTKTKRKPTGDFHSVTKKSCASRRGGESSRATERDSASTKSKRLGEPTGFADCPVAEALTRDGNFPLEIHKTNGRSTPELKSMTRMNGHDRSGGESAIANEPEHSSICGQLQELQRRKVVNLKSRIMIDNRLVMSVATEMGYHAGMDEKDREARQEEARQLIAGIEKGKVPKDQKAIAERVAGLVANSRIASDGFDVFLKGIEKEMCTLAVQLGPAKWINGIRGVGLQSLATIIGESGDLSNYANPGKLWKRLGLAPFNGKMPSTWRVGKEGKLTAEQWSKLGYSPRRRSVMYVIGECIVKQNDGAYRARYDEAKLKAAEAHKDWSKGRCHNHAMLLATKRLVLDLWKQWRDESKAVTDAICVAPR